MNNERREFNFTRTICGCGECRMNCEHMPGYLIPADVTRIAAALRYDNVFKFALRYLRASPGATVMKDGKIFNIPTLVPARRDETSNACIFLTSEGKCRIHAVSPFGCAYFSCDQSSEEADRRSAYGLMDIQRAWDTRGNCYALIWRLLKALNYVARRAETARAEMRERISGRHRRQSNDDRNRIGSQEI